MKPINYIGRDKNIYGDEVHGDKITYHLPDRAEIKLVPDDLEEHFRFYNNLSMGITKNLNCTVISKLPFMPEITMINLSMSGR